MISFSSHRNIFTEMNNIDGKMAMNANGTVATSAHYFTADQLSQSAGITETIDQQPCSSNAAFQSANQIPIHLCTEPLNNANTDGMPPTGPEIVNLWVDLQIGAGEGTADQPTLFACLWADCEQRIVDRELFEAHIEQHLAGYAHHLAVLQTQGPQTSNFAANPMCQVRGCQIPVASLEELSRHLKMHTFHANKQRCGLQLVRERYPEMIGCNFPATSRLVYQGDPLICEWNACNAAFTDINLYMAHIEEHFHALKQHQANRNEQGDYVCPWTDCQMICKQRAALRGHVQHHSGDKMCACPFCGAFFSHSSRLLEHVVRRQPGDLICNFCRKKFANETVLRKHCKRHIKQHKCDFCSLVLDTPHDLQRHIQGVHAKVRNHSCEYCDKSFNQKSDLNRHVELHFSDKLHDCPICGQSYRWAKQLREHVRRHSADYIQSPYRCHLCESRYRRGSALSKHLMQTHKLEVPTGFSRFQYKKCSDGLFRLQTRRYVRESLMESMEDERDDGEEEEILEEETMAEEE